MASKGKYDIKVTTYKKVPTGKMNRFGKPEYVTQGKPNVKIRKNTNFAELNKATFNSSVRNENVFVNYSKPTYQIRKMPRRINSVTKKFSDGSKEVTYFKPVRK